MTLSLRSLVAIGVAAFLVFLIALLPAQIAAMTLSASLGFQYETVGGSAWNMAFRNVRWQGRTAAQLNIEPAPLSLLLGDVAADIDFAGEDQQGSLRLQAGEQVEFQDFALLLDVKSRFGALSFTSPLSISGDQFVFGRDGRCTAGTAHVRAAFLDQAAKQLGVEAPMLEGTAMCDNGDVLLQMGGESGAMTVRGTGRWKAGQAAVLDVRLVFAGAGMIADPLKSMLEFAGLQQRDDGWHGQLSVDIF